MRTPQLLCSVVALSAALAGCQRSTAQADVNAAKADAKQTATNVASDVKAGTETVAAKAGDELSDAWITTKIQSKFVADHEINARDIKVSSHDGVVTLRGLIQNEPMRSLAVAVAKNTTGVKQVLDQLSVTVAAPGALHAGRDGDGRRRWADHVEHPGKVLPRRQAEGAADPRGHDQRRRHAARRRGQRERTRRSAVAGSNQ